MVSNYSVFGLGKLGASMAASMANQGFNVIGVDVNLKSIELVNAGHAPVQETNLEEMIAANKARICATLDYRDAVLNSDLTFVVVPTPSDERGAFSLKYAASAFEQIGRALTDKQSYHNVVLTSTVLPGSVRYGLLPILERHSGKKCGADFGLCYSPEFIALGSVIHDFMNPDFTLVGEFDERCGSQLEACYARIMLNNPSCMRMSIENAELTKIALNSFVTTKITFANMLADLCERIPGGNVDVVTHALGFDRRIGHQYLKGALGYGGPCFPRDNVALGFMARTLDSHAALAETTDRENRSIPGKIVERLRPLIREDTTIAVLGLAYKPLSHVVEESQGVYLAEALTAAGARVIAYDPMSNNMASTELPGNVLIMDSAKACLDRADIVLITTPDPMFRSIKATDFGKPEVTVVDFWRLLDKELTGKPNIRYMPIGRSIDGEANAARLAQLWSGTGRAAS